MAHLLQLQKEIKEEEEEIFADINSLIDSRSYWYASLDEDDQDFHYDDFKSICSGALREKQHHLQPQSSPVSLQSKPIDEPDPEPDSTQQLDYSNNREVINDNNDYYDDYEEEEQKEKEVEEQQDNCEQQELSNDGEDTNQYPEEYGFSNYNQDDPNEYQNIQLILKQMTSNLPKPCVFFLEGNCRRSDCKYSHDLSNIPCKYWIEGFCFKGEMCPFLHSLPSDPLDPDQEDENGIPLSKKQLNPTFVIDSEADFPSLSLDAQMTVINDNTKSGMQDDAIANTIRNQILSSNGSVIFKTVKKKRKKT